ncbi:MAG: dTDP-4-dehydrorhamnose reductase [Ignavibacteria bacterium]|nr:MAG: dTDP-4-dehydrorhamnose reductase [Ignavibacteria bacterium]KAF0159310.1 MAG: dTDP-4-dehydrorhamnose reductase [Ignavibacteria bacterium]
MKIFITGGSGLIGQYLNIKLSNAHDILTQFNNNTGNCIDFNSVKLPITDYGTLANVFKTFKPDLVIHTAAISNADKADSLSADIVYEINVTASEKLAELCRKNKTKLIYTSTDLVYAGYRGSLLTEDAKLIPISLYAETKLMGEVKIRKILQNHLILRVALQFGFGLNHSRSHFQFVYEELKAGRKVKLFADQFRSAISIQETARMIAELIEKDVYGVTVNFGGGQRVSRYDLGKEICRVGKFDENLIEPVTMEGVNTMYKVPDVSMNIDKLKQIGIEPKQFSISVEEVLRGR